MAADDEPEQPGSLGTSEETARFALPVERPRLTTPPPLPTFARPDDTHGHAHAHAHGRSEPTTVLPPLDPDARPGSPLPPLPPPPVPMDDPAAPRARRAVPPLPGKITVARVAARRSRQIGQRGLSSFHRAASADGADESGLTRLTYAVMTNYAADAALAVALANTLFFAAATAESRQNVVLYLLITVAPFAVVAPVIGPLLDRVQQGRRWALAGSFALRLVLAIVMALEFDTWLLYPCALGILVLSKSFGVLKAAVTPRVLPPALSLVRTNSRLTVFGLLASLGVGAVASVVTLVLGSPGVLLLTAAVCGVGVWLCLRIPAWVELTEGEVPTTLLYVQSADAPRDAPARARTPRQPLGRTVLTNLWGNGTVRLVTGFLTLFVAFVVKARTEAAGVSASQQLAMLALLGAGAGAGAFAGNAAGARLQLGRPDSVVLWCGGAAIAGVALAAAVPGIGTAALAALVAAAGSALAKVSLDATLQRDLPEASRASAFGRAETVLQLSWVFGGTLGVLLPARYPLGFTIIAVVAALGLAQTLATSRGASLLPGLGGVRPRRAPAATRAR